MKLKNLLTGIAIGFCIGGYAQSFDFEDGSKSAWTNGWGNEDSEIVVNPYPCGNTSSKCLKIATNSWGILGFSCSEDLSQKIVAVDVFSPIDVTVKCYSEANDKDLYLDAEKNKWKTLYFDFRSVASNAKGNLSFGPSASEGTVYIDNVRFVTDQSDAVVCDEALVAEICKPKKEHKIGSVAIGGGGFVPGIIASGKTKLARTDVGGAYKWNEEDCSWQIITNFISEANKGLYSIDAMAIDPSNENNIYLLGGCEYFSNQKTAVMYSKDGGETFNTVDVSDLIFTHGNGDGRNCGERIAVDPNNSDIVYCGGRANNPLIKSTDGGKSWSAVSSFPKAYTSNVNWPSWDSKTYPSTSDANGTTAVVFDGSSQKGETTQRIFVGISRTGAENVFVTEDGGATWSAVSGLPNNFIPCRMKMDPNGNLLIAYSDKKAHGANGAIYRYNPTTKTAENISPATGVPFGDVAVSPKDANKLFVSTNNLWVPQKWDTGKTANGDRYWTSTDGGKTWRDLNGKFTITNNGVTWIPNYAIHWSGTACFDPTDDNKISVGSGNGIFSCNNIWCESEPTFYFDVNGLEETVLLDLVSIPDGDLLSVIGDYTGFIHKDIHTFAEIHDPAPGTSGGINYYSKNSDVMMRVANQGFYYTTTGYDGWTKMSNTTYSYTSPYGGSAMPSHEGKCAITQKNGTYRFFLIPGPKESGIFYSDDNGATWNKIAGTEDATHIQVDPIDDATVYAGGENCFFSSSNYGENFTKTTLRGNLGRISTVVGEEGVIYAPCASSGLYVSTDKGKTFAKSPKVNNCSAVGAGVGENGNGYAIYIYGIANDCSFGIFKSEDKGDSWQIIEDEGKLFGGPGNGGILIGDWNVAGRFYMSSIGMGIIYGEPSEKASSSKWKCFEDNTDCKIEQTSIETIAMDNVIVSPNPFSNSFTIEAEGYYIVTNAIGQIIEKGSLDGTSSLGANWPKGIYFLSIDGHVQTVIKK
jgi:hypothetical protein